MPQIMYQRPCTDPLNWNLHVGGTDEIYIPFHDYVQLERTCLLDVSFPQFVQLPTELQMRVFYFCSSSTLFQLMHVSSSTRNEARKLFWSNPDSRYVVSGQWLQAGGLSGHTHDAVAAFAHMKHVEVDFYTGDVFRGHAWDRHGPLARRPAADVVERLADEFWQTFQRYLPCATTVILKTFDCIEAGEAAPADLTALAERCPARIRASTSCIQTVVDYRCRISLWQQVGGSQSATWELVVDDTTQKVLPPTKTFRGPVGAFSRYNYHLTRIGYLLYARPVLLNQAIEAYYTQNPQVPFVCPVSECDFRFKTPREWALHACEANHPVELEPPTQTLKMLFSEHDARLQRIKRDIGGEVIKMQMEWGEEGSEQRRKAEEAFLHQLEHDPEYAYEEPPRQTRIWRRYQIEMNDEITAY